MTQATAHTPPRTTVAMVEDTAHTIAHFERLFAAHSQQLQLLQICTTGGAMVDWLAGNAPDVLLVDLGLPDMSGIQVIEACRRLSPNTDILVITLFGDETHMLNALAAGATGYLLKDGQEAELAAHIENLRAGGSPMSPVIARKLIQHMYRARPAAAPDAVASPRSILTDREQALLVHLAKGFSYAEIGHILDVSVHTVATHVKNIYRKLEVHSKTEAIFEARNLGLLLN